VLPPAIRTRSVAILATGWMASGCAIHRVGTIEPEDGGIALVSLEGGHERLMLVAGGSEALRQLPHYLVEIDGRKGLGAIQVTRWRALEGPHGMAVYVGPVQRLGVQVGIADAGSGQLLVVDEAAARELAAYLGDPVAVEAYVDGAYHLQVVGWVPLEP
jgi:hypothetical protein